MNISDHGGECCGVKHVYRFSDQGGPYGGLDFSQVEWNLSKFKSQLIEVTLTDSQVRSKRNREFLKDNKFRLVTRFYNNNSGNMVNVFHAITGRGKNTSHNSPWFKYPESQE